MLLVPTRREALMIALATGRFGEATPLRADVRRQRGDSFGARLVRRGGCRQAAGQATLPWARRSGTPFAAREASRAKQKTGATICLPFNARAWQFRSTPLSPRRVVSPSSDKGPPLRKPHGYVRMTGSQSLAFMYNYLRSTTCSSIGTAEPSTCPHPFLRIADDNVKIL